jgi:hypothetical protein
VIAGIGWELVRRAVDLSGDALPDFRNWDQPHWLLQVPLNPAIYAAVLDDGVISSGAELLLHAMPASIQPSSDGWEITLCRKEGLVTYRALRVIDCTGDADVVGLAGFPRLTNDDKQPGTLMIRVAGYDLSDLCYPALEASYRQAVATGRLRSHDIATSDEPVKTFLRAHGENAIHVTGIDGSTSVGRTDAELEARRAMLRLFTFLKEQPGLEGLRIESWAVECGIRETYTIDAETRITAADYAGGRVWSDAVCHSYYPIDVHRSDGDGIDIRPLDHGVVPTISRSAMIPRGSKHLMVAGRTVAGDQAANSGYRVQASCMAMGQAAGAIAALSSATGVSLGVVPMDDIRGLLRDNGAIVPGDVFTEAVIAAEAAGRNIAD